MPKKEDLTNPNNYIGIALSSIIAKTLDKMILNRIRPAVEQILRINQNGHTHFADNKRCKGKKPNGSNDICLFQKAFDTVHRDTMIAILRAYEIPSAIVEVVNLLYTGTKAKVYRYDGQTDIFEILAGVLQGDTLTPYIFAIVIDYCMN